LLVRRGLKFRPWLFGGGQEQGRRSGTENTPGIVGMGIAARAASEWLHSGGPAALAEIRDHFENLVLSQLPDSRRNGDPSHRLPNTAHLSFDGCDSAGLLILLDDAGIACSAGSACMTGKSRPSHVQLAMGIPESTARSSLRFSLSRLNPPTDADSAATAVVRAVEKLRRIQGRGVGPVTVYA
jgi:cysteine desulfurase